MTLRTTDADKHKKYIYSPKGVRHDLSAISSDTDFAQLLIRILGDITKCRLSLGHVQRESDSSYHVNLVIIATQLNDCELGEIWGDPRLDSLLQHYGDKLSAQLHRVRSPGANIYPTPSESELGIEVEFFWDEELLGD